MGPWEGEGRMELEGQEKRRYGKGKIVRKTE